MNIIITINALLALILLSNSNFSKAEQNNLSRKVELPFSFELGKTTLPESRKVWQQANIQPIAEGKAARGTGSGIDGSGKVSVPDIDLVDIGNIDFEGAKKIRFAYFKEILYSAQSMLLAVDTKTDGPAAYTEEDLQNIEKELLKKYGNPDYKSPYAKHLYVWNLTGGNTLYWGWNKTNAQIIYKNTKKSNEIETYVKQLCKQINTKDHITCW